MKKKARVTARREYRRIKQKRERAAARQLLHNGGGQKVLRGFNWSDVSRVEVDLEEEGEAPLPATKKKREPKGCPAREGGKRHHYLYEIITERSPWDGREIRIEQKMCGYCGLTKTVNYDIGNGWSPRRNPTRRRKIRTGRTPGNC